MIAHLRVKIFGSFFPGFAISQCYLLMIGNNVVWRICRICTVTVTQFAQSQLQARIFCKSGSALPRKPGPCAPLWWSRHSKPQCQLNSKIPLRDVYVRPRNTPIIKIFLLISFTSWYPEYHIRDLALQWIYIQLDWSAKFQSRIIAEFVISIELSRKSWSRNQAESGRGRPWTIMIAVWQCGAVITIH